MTWSRDTHGLFDYESNYITKKNLKSKCQGKLIRIENQIEFMQSNEKLESFGENAKPLISIKDVDGT